MEQLEKWLRLVLPHKMMLYVILRNCSFANELSFKKGIALTVVAMFQKLIYIICLPFHFSEGNIKNGRTGLK